MNTTHSFPRQFGAIGRISLLVVVAVVVVFVTHLLASWLAPVAAVPLLVASWMVGLGVAIFLPFAIVVVAAGILAR